MLHSQAPKRACLLKCWFWKPPGPTLLFSPGLMSPGSVTDQEVASAVPFNAPECLGLQLCSGVLREEEGSSCRDLPHAQHTASASPLLPLSPVLPRAKPQAKRLLSFISFLPYRHVRGSCNCDSTDEETRLGE